MQRIGLGLGSSDETLSPAPNAPAVAVTTEPQIANSPTSSPQALYSGNRTGIHKAKKADLMSKQPPITTSVSRGGDAVLEFSDTQIRRLFNTSTSKGIARLRKTAQLAIYLQRVANDSARIEEDPHSLTRAQLMEKIFELRLAEGIVDEFGEVLGETKDEEEISVEKKAGKAVLGNETLKAIRSDMMKMTLPSWFASAPKHPGAAMWGTFKADEWKSFAGVNLPITLSRLWGSGPQDGRRYKMLENFLHLVTAVNAANLRIITESDIDLYEHHMRTYLHGFLDLYPHMDLTPYQHLSLHFPEHLRRFGPTHSWRCWAFERYNGIIQMLPTNNRFGKQHLPQLWMFHSYAGY